MKVALINPNWRYGGSIYFGCGRPHLPLDVQERQPRRLHDLEVAA